MASEQSSSPRRQGSLNALVLLVLCCIFVPLVLVVCGVFCLPGLLVACLGLGDYCFTTREEAWSLSSSSSELKKTLHPKKTPQSGVCLICLSNYTPDEKVGGSPNPECTHIFHMDCILKWLERKPTCPCCRASYVH